MNRVALVGYTNAGKSSLLNTLSHSSLYTESRLFATLDPATREVWLGNGMKALATDTVGFIKRLPHTLIASFRSTLEEVKDADILLHVVDVASRDAAEQIEAVNEVLKEIGAHTMNVFYVFNKADLLNGEQVKLSLLRKYKTMHSCLQRREKEWRSLNNPFAEARELLRDCPQKGAVPFLKNPLTPQKIYERYKKMSKYKYLITLWVDWYGYESLMTKFSVEYETTNLKNAKLALNKIAREVVNAGLKEFDDFAIVVNVIVSVTNSSCNIVRRIRIKTQILERFEINRFLISIRIFSNSECE